MVAPLLIAKPIGATATASTGGSNAVFALTPDPKEAWSLPAGATGTLDLDLGAALPVDVFFAGYHTAQAAGPTWRVEARSSLGGAVTATPVPTTSLLLPIVDTDQPRNAFARSSTPTSSSPVTSRYWRFTIDNPSGQPTLLIPILALGLSIQAQNGREYGSGRFVGDTGTADRRKDGGFIIDEGATYGGFEWQFGDLTDEEVARLYALMRNRGTSKTILLCEDPDPTLAGLNERLHWGRLTKIATYERYAVGATRWGLTVEDWA